MVRFGWGWRLMSDPIAENSAGGVLVPDSRRGPGEGGTLRTTDLQAAELFDRALLRMSAVSMQGVLLWVNDAMCQPLGGARKHLVGTSAVSLCRRIGPRGCGVGPRGSRLG